MLLEVCEGALKQRKEELENDMSAVARSDEDAWKRMVTYKEINIDANVRQDSIIDEKTNENLVKFPLRPSFRENELRKLGVLETYDTTAHLAHLSVVAHAINEKFHGAVRSIFEIDEATGVSKNGKLSYRAGPLKDLGRCKSKTEDDYFDASFPSSSKVLDIVRGSLIFSSCGNCMEALETLEKAVRSKKTCIKEVGRVKNMFSCFYEIPCAVLHRASPVACAYTLINRFLQKLEMGEAIDSYADIKANVLVTDGQKSMICELQFLLKSMIKAKKQLHAFYEVMRTQTFRENVVKMRNLYVCPKEAVLAIAMRQNGKELGRFMLNNRDFDYFETHTAYGASLIHYLSQSGGVKMMKLLLSTLPKEGPFEDVLNMKGPENKSPLFFAVENGRLDMVKVSSVPLRSTNYTYNARMHRIVLSRA